MCKLKITDLSSNLCKKFNEEIFKKYIGENFEKTSNLVEKKANILIFGNHLESADNNSIICGSGFRSIKSKVSRAPQKILLLRGPYTRELLKKQFISTSSKCGDPGVLFSTIFPTNLKKGFSKKNKNFKLGIVIHENERKNPKINFFKKFHEGKIISLSLSPEKFSEQLQKCEFVISTSIEGIIFAHSYKIPTTWIELKEDYQGKSFEFYDYFANFGIKPRDVFKANLWEKDFSLAEIKSNSIVLQKQEMIDVVLDSLSETKKIIFNKSFQNNNEILIPVFNSHVNNAKIITSNTDVNIDAPELILEKKSILINEKKPFVSICTVTFNRPEFLKIAEKIVSKQDYPHHLLEWIIVDDSDGENCYKPKLSCGIKIHYMKLDRKITIGEKRNLSHEFCYGDIVVYFDDDDYYPPSRVSTAVETLTKSNKLMAGSSLLPVLYLRGFETWIAGPFGKNHATAATFAFKRELLEYTKYNDYCKCGEEKEFLKGFKIPMEQLDPFKTVIAIAHNFNTYGKEQMRQNPKKYKMKKYTNKYLETTVNRIKPYYQKIIQST